MAHLTLGVLGAMQATLADGQTVKFRSDQTRALLAFLAVQADRPHSREALIGLIWPDRPEATARHNLRQALVNLRRAISDDTAHPRHLLITSHEIQFNPASDFALDTADFDACLTACARHRHARLDNCAVCAPRLQQAIDLYRGPFLQEFFLKNSAAFEEWALTQRESLRHRALEALEALATYYEQHGDLGATRRCALRALELDPWREQSHYQVMRLLALEGQRTAALAQYENCRRVLADELGVEPSPKTRDLYEQIRSGTFKSKAEPSAHVSSPPIHDLPIPITRFIGREQELADLTRLIADPECRCISLTGPGGIGKTRLALQAANQHAHEFAQGTAFIPLASVGTLDTVIPAIANVIGLSFYGPTDPKTQLLKYLRDKQMLLIVDNVEHLLSPQQDTIADLLIEILQQAAQVKLMVTSREVLNLQGIWSFEVQGLAVPQPEQTHRSEEYSAVTLFIQRARRARPGFELNAEQGTGVVRLCRLVEGLPLAIELAAAWVRILSPAEIANEIETSLDFLNAQMRDLPERHRSMRAVFDHSWQMLTEEERHAMRRMSMFRGGFTREAAEAVASANLVLLSALVAKSLLRSTSEGRYSMHELVRQYSSDRLAQMPREQSEAREQHSTYYTNYVARLEGELKGAGQLRARAALDTDIDNIRAGWRWAVRMDHIAAVRKPIRALWYFYDMRGWYQEAEATFAWATEKMDTPPRLGNEADGSARALREHLRALVGWFCLRRGKLEKAEVLLQSSLASLRSIAGGIELADILYYAGAAAWMSGDYPRARGHFIEGLAVAGQFGNQWDVGLANVGMGLITQTLGEYGEAQLHWQRAVAIYRKLGDQRGMAAALNFSSILKRTLGAFAEAQACLRECLALSESVGDRVTYGMALCQLGLVTHALGDPAEAVGLLNECLALLRELEEFWSLLQALIGLGEATLSIGEYAASRDAYYEALQMAWERQALPEVLEAMIGMARWSVHQGVPEQALVSALFVLNHQAATEQTKQAARQLRAELEAGLLPDEIEAVQVRVRTESFEKIVQELLSARL